MKICAGTEEMSEHLNSIWPTQKPFTKNFGTTVPGLRYLVNAAGYFLPKSFMDHTENDYDTYQNYTKAFYFIIQAAATVMTSNGGGSIVNIAALPANQALKNAPASALFGSQIRAPGLDKAISH